MYVRQCAEGIRALVFVTRSTFREFLQTLRSGEGRNSMETSEKTRALIFAMFFVALVLFAVLYRPTEAQSLPTQKSHPVTVGQ
jgi:phosphatidylglycerophosphate synthase